MGYLGNPVTKNFTTTTSVQTLTGDGSVSYALSAAAAVPEDIAVLLRLGLEDPEYDLLFSQIAQPIDVELGRHLDELVDLLALEFRDVHTHQPLFVLTDS